MNYAKITNKLGEAIAEVNLSFNRFPNSHVSSGERMLIMNVLHKLQDVYLEKIRDEIEIEK